MRRGDFDEAELERQLENRGFFYRFFGRWMKAINKEWQMYPVGVVFGLGFDTATEVALLATTALLASAHVPWYAILCLPILFTAGMTLMDTTDGLFMNLAYGWAFFNPVRKVYYNLAITGLSVAICFFIGGIEALSLFPAEISGLSQTHGFWGFMYNFNINTAGFVIVGMFVVTWARRHAHLALRPHRGEVVRPPAVPLPPATTPPANRRPLRRPRQLTAAPCGDSMNADLYAIDSAEVRIHRKRARLAARYERRSSSQNSVTPRGGSGRRSVSWARSSTRRILPEIVLGRSANSIRRIRLYGATRSRAERHDRQRQLTGRLAPGGQHHVRLGHGQPDAGRATGTTAASATASCSISTLSSSNGEIR